MADETQNMKSQDEEKEEAQELLDDFIEEPGDYAFLVEMRFDLPNAEFEGRVD